MKFLSNKCVLLLTNAIASTSGLRFNIKGLDSCPIERDEAYRCLANTPGITSTQIPSCLSCLFQEMNVDGSATFNEYCNEFRNPVFCDNVEDCVAENCLESCIPQVTDAYECILEDLAAETGCVTCTLDEFVLKVE